MNNKPSGINFKRLIIGFKKGYNTPTLHENILELQKKVYIRYFRVISGLSALVLVTGRLDKLVEKLGLNNFTPIFLYICIFLTILFFFYSLYINYHRVKYMFKV